MSDNYINEDFSDDEELEQPEPQQDIKSLRRAANQKKKLEVELESMRRELAFAKAGLPLDDPRMRYFVKGYDGEMSADAIRDAALEAGFLASQQSQEQAPDSHLQAAAAAQQRVMQASSGAIADDSSEASALAALESAMREGGVEAMLDVARQFGIPTAYDAQ